METITIKIPKHILLKVKFLVEEEAAKLKLIKTLINGSKKRPKINLKDILELDEKVKQGLRKEFEKLLKS